MIAILPQVYYNEDMYYDLYDGELNFAHKLDKKPVNGPDYKYHYHTVYELLLLLEGDVNFIHETKCYSLVKGDLLFVKPGQNHNVSFQSHRPYERYVLKFPENEIPEPLQAIIRRKNCCYSVKNTVLYELFARLDYHRQHYSGEFLNALNRGVLKEILYYFCAQDEDAAADLLSYNQTITSIVDYIERNIEEPIGIADICERFHYSKSYLYKIFLDEMKVPIMRYIRTRKILYADSLIKRGIKPTVAFETCGFSEYTSFYRAYKSIIGHPPSGHEAEARK